MEMSREKLVGIYSSKTDFELLTIDEEKLTDLAFEVLQEVKKKRNITEKMCKETKEKLSAKKQQDSKNKTQAIKNKIKKYLFYLYIFIVFCTIKPSIQRLHSNPSFIIIPIILLLPIIILFIKNRKTK